MDRRAILILLSAGLRCLALSPAGESSSMKSLPRYYVTKSEDLKDHRYSVHVCQAYAYDTNLHLPFQRSKFTSPPQHQCIQAGQERS